MNFVLNAYLCGQVKFPHFFVHRKFVSTRLDSTEQSRRCPLCSQSVGEYLIHHIRSKYDYQKHYLNPLRTSPAPLQPLVGAQQMRNRQRANRRTAREGGLGRRERQEREEADQLARAIARRRWIYEHDLYAKVRLFCVRFRFCNLTL